MFVIAKWSDSKVTSANNLCFSKFALMLFGPSRLIQFETFVSNYTSNSVSHHTLHKVETTMSKRATHNKSSNFYEVHVYRRVIMRFLNIVDGAGSNAV